MGSTPTRGTNASIAQLVESLPCKQVVVGSSPTRSSKYSINWSVRQAVLSRRPFKAESRVQIPYGLQNLK